jgi:hypothetical protein
LEIKNSRQTKMRIKQEGDRMILKNYNIQRFIFGFIFAAP